MYKFVCAAAVSLNKYGIYWFEVDYIKVRSTFTTAHLAEK